MKDQEKLPQPNGAAQPLNSKCKCKSKWRLLTCSVLAACIFLLPHAKMPLKSIFSGRHAHVEGAMCPQVGPVYPSSNAGVYKDMSELIGTPEFEKRAIEWLSGAVRVP